MANKYYLPVKEALYMTNAVLGSRENIESLTKAYNKWAEAEYPSKPDPPKLKVEPEVQPEVPKVLPSIKRILRVYAILLIELILPISTDDKAILVMASFMLIPFYLFFTYPIRRKKLIKQMQSAPEHQEEYRKRLAERYERQKANEERHIRDMEEYETKTIPEWEAGQSEWPEKKAYKMKFYEDAVNSAYSSLKEKVTELNDFYIKTGLIPVGYRDPDTLESLCRILGSSDYDIKSAIELLDRNRQMSMLAEQNDYLAQQTAIAERTMREARLHYVASAVQHHNTNKQLKQINEKLNK